MDISVFGLGYVGVVTAACLAREGHEVIGVDISEEKVNLINAGHSPVIENDIEELIRAVVAQKNLRTTIMHDEAIKNSDMAIVCVGTPSKRDGGLETSHVETVARQIGAALRDRSRPFAVVLRSTTVPGTTRNLILPALEHAAGRKVGEGFDVIYHPEFLREGSSVADFYDPPKIVAGERMHGGAAPLLALYGARFQAPRLVCALEEAEMVKYCDNLFHALKVTFANEIGQFCQAHNVNSQEVMRIFCEDVKLNISKKYLRPGFAFGGSCLPKDLRAFLAVARERNLRLPVLENVLESNREQVERALRTVLDHGARKVGFYGIAFKPGTDDLRESPFTELAERLIGKGRELVIFDRNVQYARLVGGNRSFVETHLPHLARLLCDRREALDACELVVLNHPAPAELIEGWLAGGGKTVLDLTGHNEFAGRAGYLAIA